MSGKGGRKRGPLIDEKKGNVRGREERESFPVVKVEGGKKGSSLAKRTGRPSARGQGKKGEKADVVA